MFPGTISEEIDNERLNDPNMKEGNERFYLYPQGLYSGLMISKQDLKFNKPDNIGEETYKYEWLRTYLAILNKLLIDLGSVCSCSKMTTTEDWQFLCMVRAGKKGNECWEIDYCRHNLEAFQNILSDRTYYPDRTSTKRKGVVVFPQMFKNIHRIIAHTYYQHKDIFNKYEEKYHLNERFLLFSRRVIKNAGSGMETSSINSTRTINLSVFSAKMHDKNISVPEIKSQKEISKIQKQPVCEFYNDCFAWLYT
jgi:hypothetical protein